MASAASPEAAASRRSGKTADDYRIASAFSALQGPLGPSPAQRHHLVDLEDRYWEDDREGADTAPLALAWRAAARDLDIRSISPYRLSDENQPEVWCPGLLPDFGGTKGTVILGRFSSESAIDLADELGYCSSGLNPLYYECYERELFEETLNDWGLSGRASGAPPWFRRGIGRHGGPEDSAPLP